MFLYHLPNPTPAPRVRHLLIWGETGVGGGGAHNVEDGVPTFVFKMVLKGGGATFTCSWPQSPRDELLGFHLGKVRFLSLCVGVFELGFPERLRGHRGGLFLLQLFASSMSLGCTCASSCMLFCCSVWVFRSACCPRADQTSELATRG